MSTFRNLSTNVQVTVDNSKDDRYADGWEKVPATKVPAKKSAAKKS